MRRIWLGGSPCSGKSGLADRLARELGLAVYHADDYFYHHASLASSGSTLARLASLSPEAIFLRDHETMLADFIAAGQDEFPFILADLAKKSDNTVIIEGCALLPHWVAQAKTAQDAVFYLVAEESFQRRTYAKRPWVKEVLEQTSTPETAWDNWQHRDAQYARFIAKEAQKHTFPVLSIDGGLTAEEVYFWVLTRLVI
ncbi:MAG: hypothetical protein KC422_15795 [Trueperaceae bacterium]|nr:hypothetical protein [Trueperaceae bacterium]